MAKPRKINEPTGKAPSRDGSASAPRLRRRVSTPAQEHASSADRAGLSERAGAGETPASVIMDSAAARRTRGIEPSSASGASREARHDEIAQRAYEIYVRRGGAPGNPMDDWIEAERQLREERFGRRH